MILSRIWKKIIRLIARILGRKYYTITLNFEDMDKEYRYGEPGLDYRAGRHMANLLFEQVKS